MSDKYSQQDEETHILAAFPPGKGWDEPFETTQTPTFGRPRFLDIGAWNPTVFSNTRALFERGWSGIFIEPSPGPVKALVAEYGTRYTDDRAIVIAAAMALETGLVRMAISDDAVTSTDGGETHKKWADAGGYLGVLHVPAITPADFFARFGGDFAFINVDTEGTSVDIFREILTIGVHPDCWCVEHDGRHVEIHALAAQHNYNVVYGNDTNVVLEVKR